VVRVGHIRVFAGLASAASVAALIYSLAVHPATWALMRFLTGVCFAGLFVVAESWINSIATNGTRGRLMATYMVTLLTASGLGQLLLNVANPAGFELFIVSSVLISLAVIPITLARSPAPDYEQARPVSIFDLARRSPLGTTAGLLTGAANAAVVGMGPVYATIAGFDTLGVTLFMAASLFGGVALQWPLGRLSDLVPRRRVLLGVSTAATATALVGGSVAADSATLIVIAFLFGGLALPMYSLAISYVNDTTPDTDFVGSAAAFIFVSGIGSIAGPLFIAAALELLGTNGYWWSLALFYTPVAVVALYRIVSTARIKTQGRIAFVPPRISPVMGRIIDDYESQPDEPPV
jgi:MFS family permease